jgi:hypothetical protein
MSTPTPKPDFVTAVTEPESAANTDYQPVYPYNKVTQTKGGHSFEMDDTPTRERIRLQHRSGTFTEMHPNGDQVTKILGDGYSITLGDHNIIIGVDDGQNAKKLNITVNGDAYFHVTGDKIEQIDGSVEQHIKGDYTQTVEGMHTVSSFGNMKINAGSSLLGKLTINTPDYVRINGDLGLSGELKASKVTSDTRVDAGTGVSAGLLGFVTMTGGVSVGIPAAIPGQIVSLGSISSFTSVSAPLGNFGISSSLLAYDIVNELLRKVHNHAAPLGLTSPPLNSEVT